MKFWLIATFLFCATALPCAQSADGVHQRLSNRFCIVPVLGGTPEATNTRLTLDLASTVFEIPGLSAPVFVPIKRSTRWTISKDRQLVRYDGPFPRNFFDKASWVYEPWNSRVVAKARNNLVILRKGYSSFEQVKTQDPSGKQIPLFTINLLPSRRLTVVTDPQGKSYKIDGNQLVPWITPVELSKKGIQGIYRLYDAPTLPGIVVLTTDRQVYVLDKSDKWNWVGSVGKRNRGQIFDAPGSGVVLFVSKRSALVIKRSSDSDGGNRFIADVLPGGDRKHERLVQSKMFGQVLRFAQGNLLQPGSRWQRLTTSGFVDIPGGETGRHRPDLFPHVRVLESRALERLVIRGHQGLHLYDGEQVYPVPNSGENRLATLPRMIDLPSIGRMLIVAKTGLFDLSIDGKLTELSMPFPTGGLPGVSLIDWPQSGVAVASTAAGIFVIDQNLNAEVVQGAEWISHGWHNPKIATIAATGELVLASKQGLFLAADRTRSGKEICDRTHRSASAIPQSNLCLAPVEGTEQDTLGFAIGSWMPTPEGKGLLIETVGGLFHLDGKHQLHSLQPRKSQFTRTLSRLPWSQEVLAVGGGLETVIGKDLSIKPLNTKPGFSLLIGVAPSLKGAIVVRSKGSSVARPTYLLNWANKTSRETKISAMFTRFFDAPWWGHGVVDMSGGLHALKPDGSLQPMKTEGAPRLRYKSATQILSRNRNLRASDAIPLVRLKSVLVWSNSSREKSDRGWYLIAEDKVWRRVSGLPSESVVHTTHDPGNNGILLGTSTGVYRLDKDSSATPLAGNETARNAIYAFARSVDGRSILAGGNKGLFRISQELDRIEPWQMEFQKAIGSVSAFTKAELQGLVFVHASLGTYAINAQGELSRVDALSPAKGVSGPVVIPRSGRMFALRRRAPKGAMIFGIGRETIPEKCTLLE